MDLVQEKVSTNGSPASPSYEGPFVSMVNATRTPMVITNPRLPDNPIVYANAAFISMSGYSDDEIIGKNCRFLQGPGTDPADVDRLRTAIAESREIEVDLLNYRKDGTSFWNRLMVSPVVEGRTTTFFVASQQDVTLELEELAAIERRKMDLEAEVADRSAALHASEQSLRLALEAGRLGIWTIDLATGELTASAECKSICGRSPNESLSLEDLRDTIHPDDRLLQIEAINDAIENKSLLESVRFSLNHILHA